MRSFLLQPYPFGENPWRKLALCAGIGLFIALFLGVFKPFGFDQLPVGTTWKHAFLFGLITFLISSLFQILLPSLFPRPFAEDGWRSWKEIVYLLITTAAIGAGNFLLNLSLYPQKATLQNFLWSQLTTLEVGVFPVLFIVFMKQLRLYRRFSAEAEEVTQDMQESKKEGATVEPPLPHLMASLQKHKDAVVVSGPLPVTGVEEKRPGPRLLLRGDNQKEELSLLPDDLLFIASADNYVNVHYCEGGLLKSSLLRGSLKGFEEQLSSHPAFFRCHRMYLVNLIAVKEVSGNAQGLKLHLTAAGEAIPVSRNLTETVKKNFTSFPVRPKTPDRRSFSPLCLPFVPAALHKAPLLCIAVLTGAFL